MNKISDEDVIAELLTLDCKIDEYGTKCYYNKESKFHRVHGLAVIFSDGHGWWYKNGKYHREDGPAIIWVDGREDYYINGNQLTKDKFIQWQIENGIKSTE